MFNNAKVYKRYVSKPIFVSQKLFSKSFVAIHEIKPFLTFDKPIYSGFNILELSKCFMYDFHYNYVKRKFNAELLLTDTDSLDYKIETDDVYKDFY